MQSAALRSSPSGRRSRRGLRDDRGGTAPETARDCLSPRFRGRRSGQVARARRTQSARDPARAVERRSPGSGGDRARHLRPSRCGLMDTGHEGLQPMLGGGEIFSIAQLRSADAAAIAAGIAGIELMENAGAAVAEAITARFVRVPVIVLCGPGNNGGDGFVVARRLARAGCPVRVAPLGRQERLRGDAATAAKAWSGDTVALEPSVLQGAGLVVDALLGAGLARPIEGGARATIEAGEKA